MPLRKNRLTRFEEEEFLQAAQQLRDQGVRVEIPEEWVKRCRRFEITIAPGSSIYVRSLGITYYMIFIQCTALQSNSALQDGLEITTGWDDDVVPITRNKGKYRIGRLHFDRDEVLNERLETCIRFPQIGSRVEGWLLAHGIRPVPPEYGAGNLAPFELKLSDHNGRIYSAHAMARVERSAQSREMAVANRSRREPMCFERVFGSSHDVSAGKLPMHAESPNVLSGVSNNGTDVGFHRGGSASTAEYIRSPDNFGVLPRGA
jgi:hypothetical protein